MADPDTTFISTIHQAVANPDVIATSDPIWNERVRRFLLLDAVQRSDYDFGPTQLANEAFDLEREVLVRKYGKQWALNSDATAQMDAVFEGLQKREEERVETLVRPMWSASVELAKTPAPTLAALLFKIELIKREELDNDLSMDADPFEVVSSDAARLMEVV